ncbi:hypothetical protein MIMGU_mgv1a016758mg [Erythranthe guttata]|uniref:Uncharacterized protein n=1 Tax=Erythranthe guttata TaxID=4155 RepID=A0A022RWT9_ERYGU|nr:hypothetical protein MIMGU_mgv1a016758mg [Erythranthe guttata]
MAIDHAEGFKSCWWRWRTRSSWRMSQSLCRRTAASDMRYSFSDRTIWDWCTTNRSRFISSRFPALSRFAWFLKFSVCFCFLILDRRADSRFDSMRLRFLSSTTFLQLL